MIIWRGWGILVLVIPVAIWVIVPELVKPMLSAESYSANYQYISGLSIVLGAVALWFFGRWVNAGGRAMIDEETGERIVLKPNHSLFFINIEYWAIPLAAFAGMVLFT